MSRHKMTPERAQRLIGKMENHVVDRVGDIVMGRREDCLLVRLLNEGDDPARIAADLSALDAGSVAFLLAELGCRLADALDAVQKEVDKEYDYEQAAAQGAT
jgi:hypothetical protein